MAAKDRGSAAVLLPVAKALTHAGERTHVLVEGPAEELFRTAKVSAQRPDSAFDMRAAADLIRKLRPRAVVVGMSMPINIEQTLGLAANIARVPLVAVEDFWGAAARSCARPALIATLDMVGKEHAHSMYPDAHVVITGNPGAKKIELSDVVSVQCTDLHSVYERIILFTESGPQAVEEQLKLLVVSLRLTRGSWCLVPRFHPKWSRFHEEWHEQLQEVAKHVVYLEGSGDEVAAAADITVSVWSTMLTTAAYNKRTAVSLDTPRSREVLARESGGLVIAPQATLGYAHRVVRPTDLSALGPLRAGIKPYDPAPLVREILKC